jgi:HEAT repeat protein
VGLELLEAIKMGIFDLFKPNVKKMKAKGDVEGLIEVFKSKKGYDVKKLTIEALGELKDVRAVEPFIDALGLDYTYGVYHEYIIEALGKIGDVRAVEPLIKALENEHFTIADSAAEALAEIGEPAVEPLIQALKDKNPDIRWGATQALGDLKDERAVEPLIQTLMKDKDLEVQWTAAKALGKIGDKRAVEPLIQALKKRIIAVKGRGILELGHYFQTNIAEALGKIGDTKAIEPLITALENDYYLDQSTEEALIAIGEPAVEPLIQIILHTSTT